MLFQRREAQHLLSRGDSQFAVYVFIVVFQRILGDSEEFHDLSGVLSGQIQLVDPVFRCGQRPQITEEEFVFLQHDLPLLGGEPGGFGLGSISFATSTPNGFLALDGNMREVVLWSTDGTWLGAVSDGDLFGTGYPWIAAADVDEDGSILVVMSDTREDESADEVLVFKLSGF